MNLVHVASARPIGKECLAWAGANMPSGWMLTDSPEACDVFVSVMHDELVSERFINGKEGRRCYNFHPGLLPEYRGSGAFSWAIINGERETGVTLHELDVDIDHGPIIDVWRFSIMPADTAGSLFDKAMEGMEWLFRTYFHHLLFETYQVPYRQDERKARLYYRRDLQRARDLTRFVRAFTFGGKEPAYYVNAKGERVEVRL